MWPEGLHFSVCQSIKCGNKILLFIVNAVDIYAMNVRTTKSLVMAKSMCKSANVYWAQTEDCQRLNLTSVVMSADQDLFVWGEAPTVPIDVSAFTDWQTLKCKPPWQINTLSPLMMGNLSIRAEKFNLQKKHCWVTVCNYRQRSIAAVVRPMQKSIGNGKFDPQ